MREQIREKIAKLNCQRCPQRKDRSGQDIDPCSSHYKIGTCPGYYNFANQILSLFREEVGKLKPLSDRENVLASPLWRPLHDILIDWNEGRIKSDKSGIRGTLLNIVKGENNIKAVEAMIEVISQAQLDSVKEQLREIMK